LVKVRLWDSALGSVPESASRDSLQYLYEKRSCGILWFRGSHGAVLELHLHDGNVVNCLGTDDEALLGQLLVSSSLVSEQELLDLASRAKPRWLAEALVESGLLPQRVLQPILADLVKDQVFHACVTAWDVIEFDEDVPTFEPDLMPPMGLSEVLIPIREWAERVKPLLALVDEGHDAILARRQDADVGAEELRLVLDEIQGETRYPAFLSRAPLARYRTMDILVTLVTRGAITISPDVG